MDLTSFLQVHPHWPALQKVYHTLSGHGYRAYLAGGCVRDALLGRKAEDLDVATDAVPEVIEKIFPKTVPVGKAFGVMIVVQDGVPFEVATFRSDGTYKDGRRPEHVDFSSPQEDAVRRDFTVNALFYDLESHQVLDFVGGIEDLKRQCLRAVGDPRRRFEEDHLRLLRALRFMAQLGFEIEPATCQAIKDKAAAVRTVSPERIQEETTKFLKSREPLRALRGLSDTGVGPAIYEGFAVVVPTAFPVWEKLFAERAKELPESWARFLTPWVLQGRLPEALRIVERYRFSSRDVRILRQALMDLAEAEKFWARPQGEKLFSLGREGSREALKIWRQLGEHALEIDALWKTWEAWGRRMPEPWLRGEDLQARVQGKALGEALRMFYLRQLTGEDSSREAALKAFAGMKF